MGCFYEHAWDSAWELRPDAEYAGEARRAPSLAHLHRPLVKPRHRRCGHRSAHTPQRSTARTLPPRLK